MARGVQHAPWPETPNDPANMMSDAPTPRPSAAMLQQQIAAMHAAGGTKGGGGGGGSPEGGPGASPMVVGGMLSPAHSELMRQFNEARKHMHSANSSQFEGFFFN